MKKCEEIRELIWLAMYDEITSEQNSILENHLQTCSECQLDYEETRRTITLLNNKLQLGATELQLESSRTELHERLLFLTQPKLNKNWGAKLWQVVSLDFAPSWRFATAVALLFIGIFTGKFFFAMPRTGADAFFPSLAELLESNISNIESVHYDPGTRQVAIKLNTLNDFTIRGDIEKPEIQLMLAHSLANEERPNVRLKSVRALEQTRTLNDDAVHSLADLIDSEENTGIRLRAVKLLTSIPITPALKEVLAQTLLKVLLNDSNSAIRIEAFRGLSRIENGAIAPALFDAAKNDSSEFIRTKAQQMLERTENPVFP